MTVLGVDYAWVHPDPRAIKSAGYSFVIRYLSKDITKNITVQEVAGIHAAGLNIGLVWEDGATNALGGGDQGVADAEWAVAQARALALPHGSVIFANVGDFAATPAQLPAICAYYDKFAGSVTAAGWAPGGYGTGFILNALAARKGYWWQNAMNDAGISGSTVVKSAHIYQRVKPTLVVPGALGSYDENVIVAGTLPFWPYGPAPHPTPHPPEEDMPLNAADVTLIQNMLRTEFAPGSELSDRVKALVQNALNDLGPAIVQDAVGTYMTDAGDQNIREVVASVLAASKGA